MVKIDFIPVVFGQSDWTENRWASCRRLEDDFGNPARCQFGGTKSRAPPTCYAGSQMVSPESTELLFAATDGEPFLAFKQAQEWTGSGLGSDPNATNATAEAVSSVSSGVSLGPGEHTWVVDSEEPCWVAENYTLYQSCQPYSCLDPATNESA